MGGPNPRRGSKSASGYGPGRPNPRGVQIRCDTGNESFALHAISAPSSRGIFVCKLETSVYTKIVFLPIFVCSIKLIKSVVSLIVPLREAKAMYPKMRIFVQ